MHKLLPLKACYADYDLVQYQYIFHCCIPIQDLTIDIESFPSNTCNVMSYYVQSNKLLQLNTHLYS